MSLISKKLILSPLLILIFTIVRVVITLISVESFSSSFSSLLLGVYIGIVA